MRTNHHSKQAIEPFTPTAGAPTDEVVMGAIQKRDPEALGALYDRYGSVLKALIMRIVHNESEAEDLLQEIFIEIWSHAEHFSSRKGKLLGWMVTMARRRAIDRLRKSVAHARAEERLQRETEQQPEAWVHNTTGEDIELSDIRKVLNQTIKGLPEPQQQVVDLAFFQGMSQREIAIHTNIPLGTIKTRLELGLKKIAEGLKHFQHEF